MKKVKIKKITMLFTGLLMCIGVANIVKASSPTVIMDNFENIEMVNISLHMPQVLMYLDGIEMKLAAIIFMVKKLISL